MHSRDTHPAHHPDQALGRATGARPRARTGGSGNPLQTLHNSAGNAAVASTVAAARAGGQQRAGSAVPVQRAEMRNTPQGQAEGFGGSLDNDDLRLLGETAHRVQQVMDQARAKDPDKEVMLFIGVGTGNPASAWGNPTSGGTGTITDAHQHSPGFLSDAEGAGYTVIAVNFNVGGGKDISESGGGGPVVKLNVPARFPLDAAGQEKAKGALDALHASAGQATRFAVMNAVTQADYQPLINLANAKSKGQSAYLKSYMQTGATSSFSPMNKKKGLHTDGGTFASMGEVFPADA
ncbi:hypothetical protein OG204_12790 [Streptomyces sp. NBC_01387]|uniref:hypothetical protein n=1 Tax=unclassified Streptomyces TaxID=2593676 RepID=UPI002025645D|nr:MULTISPECIES: hypothetical protein [unclassified Streptomyces]MCX4550886.1 hypothetical protein [Streptomyces sp. NBC_01500]WSC22308.1 hypothetical protein OIE60_22930 [Streptomyces sp. NBC_01766]